MRFLGFHLWLDERNGMSYLEDPDTGLLKETGYSFEVTPVYGWPLSMIWDKNASQFATRETADRMVAELSRKLPDFGFSADREPEVRVGPFTWMKVRSIRVSDASGLLGDLNAGLAAQYFIRNHHMTALRMVRSELDIMRAKRDQPLLDE